MYVDTVLDKEDIKLTTLKDKQLIYRKTSIQKTSVFDIITSETNKQLYKKEIVKFTYIINVAFRSRYVGN